MKGDTKNLTGRLSIRRSLLMSLAQKYTSFLLTLPTIMILSRLLTPAQIGIFSVAMAMLALVHMLRDFGVSQFIVQHATADQGVVRTAFTINLLIAWTLGVGVFVSSDAIGVFYDEPGVARVLRVVSASFFLIPFGSTVRALLRRNMAFGKLYKIQTAESAIRSVAAISLALAGFGYMSLAWASLLSMTGSVVACNFWGATYRVRGVGLAHWREVTRFGIARATGDVAAQIGMRSSDIIIGRVLGMTAAGLYSRGYGLINMFRENVVGAVNAVAFSTFAERHRDKAGPDDAFLRSLTFLTAVSWPFFLFAVLMAFPIMRIMFGSQWDAAIPLMQWLAAAAMVGTLIFQCNYFFTAIGRVGVATRNEVVFQSVRVGIVLVAAYQSIELVAAAQVPVYVIAVGIYYRDLNRIAGISIRRLSQALMPSVLVTVASGLGPMLVYILDRPNADNLWIPLIMAGASAFIGWMIGVYTARHPAAAEITRLINRRRGAPTKRLSA